MFASLDVRKESQGWGGGRRLDDFVGKVLKENLWPRC